MDGDRLPPRTLAHSKMAAHVASCHTADGALNQIPHQRNLVSVELQGTAPCTASFPAISPVAAIAGLPRTASSTAFSRSGRAAAPFTAMRMRSMLPPETTIADATFNKRKVPDIPVPHFLKIELRAGPGGRNSNGGQQIAGLQDVQAGDVDFRSNEIILGVHHALTFGRAHDEFGVQRDQRRRGIGRIHRDAAVGVEDGVLAVAALGSIGVADVAARRGNTANRRGNTSSARPGLRCLR